LNKWEKEKSITHIPNPARAPPLRIRDLPLPANVRAGRPTGNSCVEPGIELFFVPCNWRDDAAAHFTCVVFFFFFFRFTCAPPSVMSADWEEQHTANKGCVGLTAEGREKPREWWVVVHDLDREIADK
jgi:hypothetical protein